MIDADREHRLDEPEPEASPWDWRCEGRGALYESPRTACDLCGGTTFESVEDLAW